MSRITIAGSLFVLLLAAGLSCTSPAPPAPAAPPVVTPAAPPPASVPQQPTTPVVPTPVVPTPPPPVATPQPPEEPAPAAPSNPLPTPVSMAADMRSLEFPRVNVVFRFDEGSLPGYYTFSLLAGPDSFGDKRVERYRGEKLQVELDWAIPAGRDAYYRLRNEDPVSGIFQTKVSYSKFATLTTIPANAPSDLERSVAELINQDRRSRGLPTLSWDDGLYRDALDRLKAFGEEGAIVAPPAGGQVLETAYSSGSSVIQDATRISGGWIVDPGYFAVVTNPAIKTVAIRSDVYDNGRYYMVGLFR